MADHERLIWDADGERFYETGVSHAVLFVKDGTGYKSGVAWNGVTGITENPSGADETKLYANNGKYLSLRSIEELGLTLEAYTYPDEFGECDGSGTFMLGTGSSAVKSGMYLGQQTRKMFALAYETLIGNDEVFTDKGKKLHVVYGCTASPSSRAYATVNDSPEAITFSWEMSTTPVEVATIPNFIGKKTASIVIDSTTCDAEHFALLEDKFFGKADSSSTEDDGYTSTLLTPDQIYATLLEEIPVG